MHFISGKSALRTSNARSVNSTQRNYWRRFSINHISNKDIPKFKSNDLKRDKMD